MPPMALAIAGLVLAWGLQSFGTYCQIRHYSSVMGEAARSWNDGFVGTGRARSRLGTGTVLLLVVDADRVIRRLLVLRGVTVLARFARLQEVEGMPLASLSDSTALRPADRAALLMAADQIERAAARARDGKAAA